MNLDSWAVGWSKGIVVYSHSSATMYSLGTTPQDPK